MYLHQDYSESYREAKKWWQKAAELGNDKAQYELAWMYENGVRGEI